MESDDCIWAEILRADVEHTSSLLRRWHAIDAKVEHLERALAVVAQRPTALRLLLLLDDSIRVSVFATVLRLACVGHSDIGLCRSVIKVMDRRWVRCHIEAHATVVLSKGDEEEYQRLAEFYWELDHDLLRRLVKQALAHSNAEVRDVGERYSRLLSSAT